MKVHRRGLLAGAAVAAAGAVPAIKASAAPAGSNPSAGAAPAVARPSAEQVADETGTPAQPRHHIGPTGSEYVVDVLQALDIDYVAMNPGSSFRGIQEALINYAGGKPELLTCLHEEISVAMSHGYAKVAGKPMAVLLHGTPGVSHAAMATYNAWCDRVPVFMVAGNYSDTTHRRGSVHWNHSAADLGELVRGTIKWSDQPTSLEALGESLMRGYDLAITAPASPVMITATKELQEHEIPKGVRAPTRRRPPTTPAPDQGAIQEAARLLAGAANPVIVVEQLVRTQAGMDNLVALAEALQAPVIDRLGRLNMPSAHPLNQRERARTLLAEADVILALELWDAWSSLYRMEDLIDLSAQRVVPIDAKLITISTNELHIRDNVQDFQRFVPADLAIIADGEASLPSLLEAVRRAMPADGRRRLRERAEHFAQLHAQTQERSLQDAAYAWDASPVSVARLCAEVWAQVRDLDWALVSDTVLKSFWPMRLWNFEKSYQYIGGSGGQGLGYGLPAAVGAALAHREHGRVVVNIQADGDMMYNPQALWTAVHHKIPLLTVMHNNRAYHQEVMHIQRIACWRERGIENAHVGTTMDDPPIDFAALAKSQGMWSEGPIEDPAKLAPAIARALEVVKGGEPALIDVVCQPR